MAFSVNYGQLAETAKKILRDKVREIANKEVEAAIPRIREQIEAEVLKIGFTISEVMSDRSMSPEIHVSINYGG